MPQTTTLKSILAAISVGELLDKITILEIKATRIVGEVKQANVAKELSVLKTMADASLRLDANVLGLVSELREVNNLLWNVEDRIRECEKNKDFGSDFVALARSVYRHNDQRALLKRKLNELTGSELIEEKSYVAYDS